MVSHHDGQADFYVASDGDDGWSGTRPEPDATHADGPFATLTRARDAVRQLRASETPQQPTAVLVRGGKYLLEKTFVLCAIDSGTPQCPVTYAAYPGEQVILSGGRRVTGWKPYEGELLQAEIPDVKRGKIGKFRQLFLDGRRQRRARWPNFDPADPLRGGWATMEGPAERDSHIAFKYKPGTFPRRWAKPHQAEINVFPYVAWTQNVVPVQSIDEESRVVTLRREIWRSGTMSSGEDYIRYANMPFHPENRFIVENVLEELDEPSEWCLDSEDGVVYFWPPEELREDSEVVIPVLDCLIRLLKTSHVTIRGFTFTETTSGDNYHRSGVEGYGAMFPRRGWKYCGEAMHLKDAEHCVVEGSRFDAVGGNGIYLEGHNHRNRIRRNTFSGVGANGVCLLGTKDRHPAFNRVEDNHFHDGGALLKYTAAVFLGVSDGNLIGHNLIHDLPHHAVNLASNGYGRNVVEFNDIRRTCLEIWDNGAINSWMDASDVTRSHIHRDAERCGHILRYNLIIDPGQGLYIDDYSSNCFIFGNVIARAGNGIGVHGGKNNVIENNVFARCSAGVSFWNDVSNRTESWQMAGFHAGNHVRNNIFDVVDNRTLATAGISFRGVPAPRTEHAVAICIAHGYSDRKIAYSEGNLFFNPGGASDVFVHLVNPGGEDEVISLEDWRRMGYDADAVVADPLFVDPEHDDYRLEAESPAYELGFLPIPMDRIGIRGSSDHQP